MAFAHALPTISSGCVLRLTRSEQSSNKIHYSSRDIITSSFGEIRDSHRFSIGSRLRLIGNVLPEKALWRWRWNAVGFVDGDVTSRITALEIPVTCYQLIGVSDQSEKDEIVKSVMNLKGAEIEEGYTLEVVVSRLDLLMDVRDKLLFEPEYAGIVKENIPPKSSLRIPWAWLPGALCLLQEVGEVKLVLEIGSATVQHPDAKPYVHDLLLSMALAECAAAKISFEKNMISKGFEALLRAQSHLRSKKSLEKLTLLSQIEESLEEIVPACTLELLSMPRSPENAERRAKAIGALRQLLRQGLDVETACQVQDWPFFLSQALDKLTAEEIADLLPWEDLANIRKNKKSIESQNQRAVIDFSCFYKAMMAHLALGFSSKEKELIYKAKTMGECLIASEGVDLKLEESFCSFLLGQGNEVEVIEKLQQVEINSNPAVWNNISGKDKKDSSSAKESLETWLKDAVLGLFPDTRDSSVTLVNFFNREKKSDGRTKSISPLTTTIKRPLPLSSLTEERDLESLSHVNSSRHIGTVIRQLAPNDSRGLQALGRSSSMSSANTSSVQLKRNIAMHQYNFWEGWLGRGNEVIRIVFMVVIGCIVFIALRLTSMKANELSSTSNRFHGTENASRSTLVFTADMSTDDNVETQCKTRNGIPNTFKKLLVILMQRFRGSSDVESLRVSSPGGLSSSQTPAYQNMMSTKEAESLVKQWQTIKADALGPNHHVDCLQEILDEKMLVQWQALADAAKTKSCYWKFVLLQLSVQRAEVSRDENGIGIAEIEALMEEAAELVDESELGNPSYYSTYLVRYVLKRREDGSWRFCEGDIPSQA